MISIHFYVVTKQKLSITIFYENQKKKYFRNSQYLFKDTNLNITKQKLK